MAWKDLSIAQRSQLMNLYRRNGITSLSEMRQNYDLFSLPSQEESPMIGHPMAPIYAGGGSKEPYLGEITQRRKWNTFDSWMARNPQVGHGLRKAGVLVKDAMRLIPGVTIAKTTISPRTMTDYEDTAEAMSKRSTQDSTADRMNTINAPMAAAARAKSTQAILKTARDVLGNSGWPAELTKFTNNVLKADRLINAAQFIDDFTTPVEQFANGGPIHIKKKNRGKFTALKKRTGHSTAWFKAHGTPAQKKMAVFAQNAAKWRHEYGGIKF